MKPETVIESVADSTGVVLTMWQAAQVGNAIRDGNWTLVRSRLVGLVGRSDEVKATEALRWKASDVPRQVQEAAESAVVVCEELDAKHNR